MLLRGEILAAPWVAPWGSYKQIRTLIILETEEGQEEARQQAPLKKQRTSGGKT